MAIKAMPGLIDEEDCFRRKRMWDAFYPASEFTEHQCTFCLIHYCYSANQQSEQSQPAGQVSSLEVDMSELTWQVL